MNFYKSKVFLFFSIIVLLLIIFNSFKLFFSIEILFNKDLTTTYFYDMRSSSPTNFSLLEEKALFFKARHFKNNNALNILVVFIIDREKTPYYITLGEIGKIGYEKFPNDPQWTGYILLSKLAQGNKLTEEEEQFLLLQLKNNIVHPSIFVNSLCVHRIYNHTKFLKEQQNFLSKNRNDIPCKFED